MHLFISVMLIFGFCVLLLMGLLSVLQELMERDFLAAPLMAERDSQPDQHPYRGDASASAAASGAGAPPKVHQPPLHWSGGQHG
jgi:hypothetical protein